mmetsp:Transcript_58102/g.65889  ORF Transcript_58102/g.65889 Transcript_58102/m.65889 type:complete len:284 (+) Transcript_58102:72-923(+)
MKHSNISSSITLLIFFSAIGSVIRSVESFVALSQQQNQITSSSSSSSCCCYSRSKSRRRITPTTTTSSLNSSTRMYDNIRFLGRGENAIVRPGCILLAPAEEFHHYLRQSAVFIYAMGTDDDDAYVIRGVIIDNMTPWTMGEMMKIQRDEIDKSSSSSNGSGSGSGSGSIYDNLICKGGDTGGEDVFCLHSVADINTEEIGTSTLYQGGDLQKLSKEDPSRVKFFFNYMEFLEQELTEMLDITHEDGDSWMSVEASPEIVLNTNYEKGECWSRLRSAIRRNGF